MSMSQNCPVKSIVKADGTSSPISAPVAAQLYRIAQEAVHNAVEHGAAREVQINLAFNHEDLVLTVRDNGKGFDVQREWRWDGSANHALSRAVHRRLV